MADSGDVTSLPVHLKAGDAQPAIDDSKYTLFAFRFCPFCDRVRLVLNYHKIDYDLIPIALPDKPDWFLRLSPSGKVPMLLYNGEKLVESDLIMRFVDELRGPDASLMKVCGLETFQHALELSSMFFRPAHSILYNPAVDSQSPNAFRQACEDLCAVLKNEYFSGSQLSLADLVLFPMIDRLESVLARLADRPPDSVTELSLLGNENAAQQYPQLFRYLAQLRILPFVSETRQPSRIVSIHAATMRAGSPDPEVH